jgi:hypothetical protein
MRAAAIVACHQSREYRTFTRPYRVLFSSGRGLIALSFGINQVHMKRGWMSCEGKRCLNMVDVGSLSGPGYKLISNPKYPDIINDFEHSFAALTAALFTTRKKWAVR